MFDVNNGKLLDRERQMTDPTSRQRGRPKKTRQQLYQLIHVGSHLVIRYT
jgi:hypothetical protein